MNNDQRKAIADEFRRFGAVLLAGLAGGGWLKDNWLLIALAFTLYGVGVLISHDILSRIEQR